MQHDVCSHTESRGFQVKQLRCEESEESDARRQGGDGAVYNEGGKERRGNGDDGGWDTRVRGKERYGVRGWTEY